ncbi:MAG TPA: hypothetical protein VEL76_41035 [Gemmataceae bacterium]|nr:hypothetical protein [Gemmataceae bacterium]
MTTRLKQAFLLVMLALSFLPVLAMLLGVRVKVDLRQENRKLAELPKLRLPRVLDAKYFTEFEKYFNDHFGLREWVIKNKQEFDWLAYHRVRPDLLCGPGRFIEYKFIAERYVPDLSKAYPKQYMVDIFTELYERFKKMGIKMLFVLYPNKPLIYPERMPSYWPIETDMAKLPFYQAVEEIRKKGVPILVFAPDFLKMKDHEQVFTDVEENHCTPVALFHSMKRILATLGKMTGTTVATPEDFPKTYSPRIAGGQHYRLAHHVNTNYPTPPPWLKVEVGQGGGSRYFYKNPERATLPSTTIFTDSFLQTLANEFGTVFLPYFQELCIDYTTFSPDSINPRTRLVVVSMSDQSVESHIHYYKRFLDRMK